MLQFGRKDVTSYITSQHKYGRRPPGQQGPQAIAGFVWCLQNKGSLLTLMVPLVELFYLQGQCTLINITVNMPELAQKAIFHL